VIPDSSFSNMPLGAVLLGNGGVWRLTMGSSANSLIANPGGHDGGKYLALTGPNISVAQPVSVVSGQPYFVSCWVSSNNFSANSCSLIILWLNNNGASAGAASVFSATGYINTWTLGPSGFVMAPSGAVSAILMLQNNSSTPSGGQWLYDDVNLQPVINQTGNGQVNSTSPTAQSSGYSAVRASSVATMASSVNGLSSARITEAGGAVASFAALGGAAQWTLDGGGVLANGSANASAAFITVSVGGTVTGFYTNTGGGLPGYVCGGANGVASQTVVLAKLTSGGNNGSMNIRGGIVTSYTPPT
jgi:hypothetical protein